MSVLKSQMIPEKHRTTIMSFFRIPINVISILSLIFTEFISTNQICLLCFAIMLVATIINFILIKFYLPPDMTAKREVKLKSEFKEVWNMSENIKNKLFK
jgi:dipeptide/tripeptide permease